ESKSVAELISFRFTGQILEACGVYRMELRFYDPVSGRFLTIDPLLQYNSPYIYGGGDWVNYHDPDGAWSWESTLSIIFGFAMVVVGVALSVVSAGIASPVGAAFAYWGATAVIGGGIAATIYGITSGINNNFDKDDLFINMSMGALFAVIGGGAGALVPATIFNLSVAATSFIVDFGVGVIVGAADGIVSNGVLNVVHGQYFFDHALANGLIGGVMGGIFGGVCGIGRGFNTVKSMMLPAADSERASTLGIGFFNTSKGHSSIWNVDTMHGTHVGYGDAHGIDLSWWRKRSQRSKMACINVTDDLMDEIAPQVYLDVGEFHRCSNNCTNYVIRKLSNAEIYAPLWARTPLTLYWWGKLLGSFT
ncbi:MAG: RHS repeat-associated core domain-containing protein, partial [Victivallaceae bacterium]